MKGFALAAVALVAMSAVLPGIALSDEISERSQIKGTVVGLVRLNEFAQLETRSSRYRETKSRTSSGLWHLTLFYTGVDRAMNAKHDDREEWENVERTARKWIDAYPNSPAAHLGYAHMLINRGWSIRGSGYAKAVRPENWKPFFAYLMRARLYLEEHKNIAASDPHWYELMAKIAYGLSWPDAEFSQLISEALRREPLFYQNYFAAIDYYSPKWGGSAEAIETFARKAVRLTKATEGFGMYARVYWYASQTQYGRRLFSESQVDWPTMKKGIDDVLKSYPDAWNINNFAKFACQSNDKEKTAELIARIGESPLWDAWPKRSYFRRCKFWAGQ